MEKMLKAKKDWVGLCWTRTGLAEWWSSSDRETDRHGYGPGMRIPNVPVFFLGSVCTVFRAGGAERA